MWAGDARSLMWAILRNYLRDDHEEVKEDSQRSETHDDRCNCGIDLPKIHRERTAKEQQRDLTPRIPTRCRKNDAIQLLLLVLAAFDHTYHCLPSTARKAEKSKPKKLEKRMAWTWTIAGGGPAHCGRAGTLLPKVVLSIL